MRINSIKDILEISVQDLFEWYKRDIYKPVPKANEVVLSNNEIGDRLSEYINYYTYFDSMHTMLEAMVKEIKIEKGNEMLCKRVIVKRDVIEHFAKEMKASYDALSRICTIKIEGNKELHMLREQ